MRQSLSERVAQLSLELGRQEGEPIEVIYSRLYREHFGRVARLSEDARMKAVFEKVRALCADGAIDPETYIAGNMWALGPWAKANPRIGFQPNHLCGENALRRYHAYLGRISRRFRNAKHTANHAHTNAGALRTALLLGEMDVGEEFVAQYRMTRSTDLDKAIDRADPNPFWRQVHARTSPGYHVACSAFGTGAVVRELTFAQLRAAAAIADQYQHGLADRIGFREFTWTEFAKLIRRVIGPVAPRKSFDLEGVPGVLWH